MWNFGKYVSELLEGKGWSRNRLAKETRLSSGYVTWLLNGETSSKPNPPNLSIDTLLTLSKALNVHPMKLILAYEDKDPNTYTGSDEKLQDLMRETLEELKKKGGEGRVD